MNLPTENTATIPTAEEIRYFDLYKRGWNCPYCLEPLMPNHVDPGRIEEGICCKLANVCFDFIDIEKHESYGLDFYIKREKEGARNDR